MRFPAKFYVAKDADGTHIIRVRLTSAGYEVTQIIDEVLGIRHIVSPEHIDDFLANFDDLREGGQPVETAYKRLYKIVGPLKPLAIDKHI
jgi:hypothetical protein